MNYMDTDDYMNEYLRLVEENEKLQKKLNELETALKTITNICHRNIRTIIFIDGQKYFVEDVVSIRNNIYKILKDSQDMIAFLDTCNYLKEKFIEHDLLHLLKDVLKQIAWEFGEFSDIARTYLNTLHEEE